MGRSEHTALDLLAALSTAGDLAGFGEGLLLSACALLRADRGALVEIAPTSADGRGWPFEPTPPLRAIWNDHHDQHPSVGAVRRSPDSCYRLRAHLSRRDLLRTPVYCDFMRPMGCRDQIAVALQVSAAHLVILGLTRADAEFTETDRYLLDRLGRPLRHLYAAARTRELSSHALTPRETTLLRLVADGYTDIAIARHLGISPRTVEKHLESVRLKLGANSRAAAVAHWLGWQPRNLP
jgi:DNA-binding CsgD family transcriptional regulator